MSSTTADNVESVVSNVRYNKPILRRRKYDDEKEERPASKKIRFGDHKFILFDNKCPAILCSEQPWIYIRCLLFSMTRPKCPDDFFQEAEDSYDDAVFRNVRLKLWKKTLKN